MAMMCEECKCSTYLNDETGMYSCENECPCCNDPDYESDWDQHLRIMKQVREYVNVHLISLNQDLESYQKEYTDSEDYNLVLGQIKSTSHILDYLDNLSYEGV
jgi:hypothetical protein